MPPQGPGGGGGGGQKPVDNHMGPVWLIIGLFVVGFIIWVWARGPLIRAFCYVKLFELSIISFFTNKAALMEISVRQIMIAPTEVPFSQIEQMANSVGNYIFIPVMIVLFVLSIVLYFRSSTSNFRHIYTMKSLQNAESVLWPQITPVMSMDLVKEHIEKGKWAMAMTPMQFIKHYKLFKEEVAIADETQLKKDVTVTVSVKKTRARQLFAMQLGPLWQGVNHLSVHNKALFAIFAARLCRDEDSSRELLNSIARSGGKGKRLNFSGVNELLKKYANRKEVKKITQEHAYVLTVLAAMLAEARKDGVLATADFLWLKPIDRRLWFLLNSVGRQTAPAEVAGPFAHWLAENDLSRKIKMPMVEEAVDALELAISEIEYVPDEESGGKKE